MAPGIHMQKGNLMGSPSSHVGAKYQPQHIPVEELRAYLALKKHLKEGLKYDPEMMKAIAHPYLRNQLLEYICKRAI